MWTSKGVTSLELYSLRKRLVQMVDRWNLSMMEMYTTVITVAYNAFSETFREEGEAVDDNRKTSGVGKVLAFAKERGVGVVAMKTMAGVPREHLGANLGEGVSLPQAKLKWVLEDDSVSAVITEMDTFDKLEENLAVSGKPLSSAESEFLMRYVEAAGRDVCRLCGTCLPGCPSGIPISDVLRREDQEQKKTRSSHMKGSSPLSE